MIGSTGLRKERKELLFQAARNKKYYSTSSLSVRVAQFLTDLIDKVASTHSSISLRTLAMGYELAQTHPDGWEELLMTLLNGGAPIRPQEVIQTLAGGTSPVKDQNEQFRENTGMSRRTFYNYILNGKPLVRPV